MIIIKKEKIMEEKNILIFLLRLMKKECEELALEKTFLEKLLEKFEKK